MRAVSNLFDDPAGYIDAGSRYMTPARGVETTAG